jgi:D-tagatose-bisphosphate aldolase class II non-catalytic subunit
MKNPVAMLAARRRMGEQIGVTSVCSSHPIVIEAALRHGIKTNEHVLIEATCNQVNHEGGYTGMTPRAFVDHVETIAGKVGFDRDRLVLGGDHLGPNPWRKLPAEAALAKSDAMIAAFVEAGFSKIHLDPSMGCAGEPEALDDETTAARAARLAVVAETAARAKGASDLLYVIGTEVPPPGGARHALDHIEPTSPERARSTLEIFRKTFATQGLSAAFERVIALVVQPGVEFGHETVIPYDAARAQPLARVLDQEKIVFEAHSTDYQPTDRLSDLVRDGFCILKVGPALTFALREALYGLDLIASEMDATYPTRALASAMEKLMLEEPGWWRPYYPGTDETQRIWRHYSYSDRIRYYWPRREAETAVERLMTSFSDRDIPAPLATQFLPQLDADLLSKGQDPRTMLLAAVERVLESYHAATMRWARS